MYLPTEKRMLPFAIFSGIPIASIIGETSMESEWQAAPGEAAISSISSKKLFASILGIITFNVFGSRYVGCPFNLMLGIFFCNSFHSKSRND